MRKAVYFYFFLSGLAGLIYEILWVRLFVMVMGGTVYSFTTVLVAFMTGLTIGGWLGGKFADRMKQSPLMVYGLLEGLIGVYCLCIPFLISGLNPIFDGLYPFVSTHNLAGLLLRFSFSALILIVPTTMMGATLPVLVRYSYRKPEEFGQTTGRLYALNTFGAVAGSFLSGMVMIPALGSRATLYLTAGLNLLIFTSILALRSVRREEFTPAKADLGAPEKQNPLNLRAGLVLVLYALSGAAAMIYQVAWTRALILSLGTTLYVLGMILTAYISGLALGAAAITPLVDRVKRLRLWCGVFEVLIGVSAWLVVPLFARLPLYAALFHRPQNYYGWLGIEFAAGFALILLPTFMMGALLPLVVRLYARLMGGVGSAVGEVYAWNTIGAILGSFGCGFFLIGLLGLRNSLVLASVMSLVIGAVFFWADQARVWLRAAFAAAVAGVIAAFTLLIPGWNPVVINSGPYMYYETYRGEAQNIKTLEQDLNLELHTLYSKEGVEATVSVFETPGDRILGLRINGKTDASSGRDMSTQILTGHLPFLFKPDAKKAAVIGLASGVTLGAVLKHPVEQVTCLEISPEVVEASKIFEAYNSSPLSDPRVRLIINDGRYHLSHTREKYDVLISEPSNPWIGGMGLLFTQDFFELAKARLKPDGIMLIWLGIYDLNVESSRMIARTFRSVFPETTFWESRTGDDYLLVGFNGPARLDYSAVKRAMADPKVQSDLARAGLDTPEKVMARFLMGPKELAEFADGGPLHTDDRRQIELSVPRDGYSKTYEQKTLPTLKAITEYRVPPDQYFAFSNAADRKDLAAIAHYYAGRELVMQSFVMFLGRVDIDNGLKKLLQAYDIDPNDAWIRETLYTYYFERGRTLISEGKIEDALNYFIKAWTYNPQGASVPALAADYYFEKGDLEKSREWVEAALSQNPYNSLAWTTRGRIELEEHKPEQAVASFTRALEYFPRYQELIQQSELFKAFGQSNPMFLKPRICFFLGEAYRQMGKPPQALDFYEQAIFLKPDYLEALLASGKIFLDLGKVDPALERLSQAVQLAPKNPFTHLLYADALEGLPARRQEAVKELKAYLDLTPTDMPGRDKIKARLSRLLKEQK